MIEDINEILIGKRKVDMEEAKRKLTDEEAQRLLDAHEADPYSHSELGHWLKLESWTDQEGLLLLAGVCPTGADIQWEGYKNLGGVLLDRPKINNALLLNELPSFYFIRCDDKSEKSVEWGNLVREKTHKLNAIESRLEWIKRLWDSCKHKGERHSPSYFIDWAVRKKIHVDWLDWAHNEGLIANQVELNPRAESTYLNIIGALLQLMLKGTDDADNPMCIFKSQADIVKIIEDRFPYKSGLKKRTLDETFSAANKKLNNSD